jgi:internalin A
MIRPGAERRRFRVASLLGSGRIPLGPLTIPLRCHIIAVVSMGRQVESSREVHIATKRGQAGVLLQRLVELVEDDRISLGARPSGKNVTGVEARAEAWEGSDAKGDEAPVRPAHEPSKVPEYYVSYAWGDNTPEGKEREAVVDRLCSEAERRRKRIIRDKTAMKIGDRISTFHGSYRQGRREWTSIRRAFRQIS